MPELDQLARALAGFYRPEEYPALEEQRRGWRETRPFAGVRIFDATPVFRNTMVKYLALLSGGADLTVAVGEGIPCDPAVVEALPQFGIRVADAAARRETFDVVMDCAGVNADVRSRRGYVELTRSGMYRYRDSSSPVFLADESRIKVIETGLGTGDGFRRGMAHFGHGDFRGRSIVLFGCGKVGRGISLYALRGGARLTVVDDIRRVAPPHGAAMVDLDDRVGIDRVLEEAWCVVCATGRAGALVGHFNAAGLVAGNALIVNMGVEDEYGDAIPAARVLNGKAPLNFVLEEPTQLRYIDPTMALDNQGALELLTRDLAPGLNLPSPGLEEAILDTVKRNGLIAGELAGLEEL